jgi:hypothetical protein
LSTLTTAAPAARPTPVEAAPPKTIAAEEPRAGSAALRWLLWIPAIAVIFSAFVVPGGLVLFLLPLAGLGYAAFSLIAWLGPDDPKETP